MRALSDGWYDRIGGVDNSGDTVFVLDPLGNIVTFLAYDESRPSNGTDDLTSGG